MVPGCGSGWRTRASRVCKKHMHIDPYCACAVCKGERKFTPQKAYRVQPCPEKTAARPITLPPMPVLKSYTEEEKNHD